MVSHAGPRDWVHGLACAHQALPIGFAVSEAVGISAWLAEIAAIKKRGQSLFWPGAACEVPGGPLCASESRNVVLHP